MQVEVESLKHWMQQTLIHIPIEWLWNDIQASLEGVQRLHPAVVECEPILKKEEMVGSAYQLKYVSNYRQVRFAFEIMGYVDKPSYKMLKIRSIKGRLFVNTVELQLFRIDSQQTNVRCTVTKSPISRMGRYALPFSSQRIFAAIMDRIREIQQTNMVECMTAAAK